MAERMLGCIELRRSSIREDGQAPAAPMRCRYHGDLSKPAKQGRTVDQSATLASELSERPEIGLLLACAHAHFDLEHRKRIRALLQEDIDWAALLQLAIKHRTIPLLYKSLAASSPDPTPEEVTAQLQALFRANGVRNLALATELLKVLRHLQDNGVCAVPYRGPLLAEVVYGDLSLRTFQDLDVLVQRKDVARAKDALVSMGYQLVVPKRLPAAGHLTYEHAYGFWHAGSGLSLELQWEVAERYFGFRVDPQVWDRLEVVRFMGRQVVGLPAEDLLLILCVHGSKHGWARLAWVCDVAELVRAHPRIDWERALWQARRHKVRRMVLLGLTLASDLLGATLPEEIGQSVKSDSAVQSLGLQVRERLFPEGAGTRRTLETSRLFVFHVQLRESLWGRVRHCFRVAMFPTWRDWEAQPLPGVLFFLYLVLRPLRLFSKHVLKRWRR